VPLYLPPSRAKPPPPPARTDDRRAAVVGLAVWVVLLVVAVAVPRVRATAGGHGLGACVAGVVIGLVFLAYLQRRDRRARRRP
jgi:membrane protein DedA with SNARE-associated domain